MVDDSYFVSTTIGLVDIKSIYDERGRHNFNSQCIHFPDSQVFEGHSTYSHNKYYFKMGLKIYYVSVIEIRVYCHFLCQTQFFFLIELSKCPFPLLMLVMLPSPALPLHISLPTLFVNQIRLSQNSSGHAETTFLAQNTFLAHQCFNHRHTLSMSWHFTGIVMFGVKFVCGI